MKIKVRRQCTYCGTVTIIAEWERHTNPNCKVCNDTVYEDQRIESVDYYEGGEDYSKIPPNEWF